MSQFVQIIDVTTSRIDEVRALGEAFRADREAEGDMPVVRMTFAADKDQPGHYINIVEFESYEAAMANSNRPETSQYASKMAELCDGPPKFINLDVMQTWD